MNPYRILVTRAAHQGSALADALRALGAEPILIPAIELTEPTSFAALDQALTHLDTFHWLLFTSANAVEAMHTRLQSVSVHRAPPDIVILSEAKDLLSTASHAGPEIPGERARARRPRIAAIGPSTARALKAAGIPPDLIPPQAVAESLTDALLPHARQPDGSPTRFLLVRAEEAREHLPETLRAAGAEVTVAPAYRTVVPAESVIRIRELFTTEGDGGFSPPPPTPAHGASAPGFSAPEAPIHAITFTSSSTARNLFALFEAAGVPFPAAAVRASIGPITSATLAELGYPAHIEAAEATVPSLAENVVKYLDLWKSS